MKKIMAMIVAFATSLFANSFEYECQDGYRFKATLTGETMQLKLPRQTRNLTQVPSASGAKYSDGSMTLFTKGDDALFTPDALGSMACWVIERTVTPQAQQKPVTEKKTLKAAETFKASGAVPGWELHVDANNDARLMLAGYEPMRFRLPQGRESGDSTLYLLKEPRMMIERHHRPCVRGNGETSGSEIVTIRYEKRLFSGCGSS